MNEQARPAIPVMFFAGPRGAGKSKAILSLLDFKPEIERWTLIVEELGNTMPDPGLLAKVGVTVRGAPYGCPCCTGNLTMRVSLARAVRELQPDRILIELPWGAHLAKTLSLLGDPLLAEVVSLWRLVTVIDVGTMAPAILPAPLREALDLSDSILLSGTDIRPEQVSDFSNAFSGKQVIVGNKGNPVGKLLEPR